jgi:ferredoxin
VCDNNNGNCTVHNTTGLLKVEHQSIPYRTKPYEVDRTNPFYRYDPNQCILCGRCVEACQNLQVNETLSIRWEDPHPRVLWDGGKPIGESSFLRAFAKKAGYKIVGVWKGIASGAKQERAERKKVLALAQARKVDVILVTELTSWGRSVLGRDSAGHPLP